MNVNYSLTKGWRVVALAAGALAMTTLAGASTIIVPDVQVFISHDSEWLVRVETRPTFSSTPTARAHWHEVDGTGEYRRKVTAPLQNRRAPILGYLSTTGTLITVGDWDDEQKLMLAVYASDGKLLQSRSMTDMFSNDYMGCLRRKANADRDRGYQGSLYWIANFERFVEGKDSVAIRDRLFGEIRVNMGTGAIQVFEGACGAALKPS